MERFHFKLYHQVVGIQTSLALKQDLFNFSGKTKHENTHSIDLSTDIFTSLLPSDSGLMLSHDTM